MYPYFAQHDDLMKIEINVKQAKFWNRWLMKWDDGPDYICAKKAKIYFVPAFFLK